MRVFSTVPQKIRDYLLNQRIKVHDDLVWAVVVTGLHSLVRHYLFEFRDMDLSRSPSPGQAKSTELRLSMGLSARERSNE